MELSDLPKYYLISFQADFSDTRWLREPMQDDNCGRYTIEQISTKW